MVKLRTCTISHSLSNFPTTGLNHQLASDSVTSKSDFNSLARARESTARSERRPAWDPCSSATLFDELCSAQADGSESEIGAGICGLLDLVGMDTPAVPCGL